MRSSPTCERLRAVHFPYRCPRTISREEIPKKASMTSTNIVFFTTVLLNIIFIYLPTVPAILKRGTLSLIFAYSSFPLPRLKSHEPNMKIRSLFTYRPQRQRQSDMAQGSSYADHWPQRERSQIPALSPTEKTNELRPRDIALTNRVHPSIYADNREFRTAVIPLTLTRLTDGTYRAARERTVQHSS